MTKVAEKLAHRFNVAPVIIKTKTKKFENVLEAIRDVVSDTEGLLVRRGQILDNIFPRIRTIPTFSMISALLPREWIFDLAEAAEVEKIYPNKIMWAFGAPRITSEGIFEVKSGAFGQSIKFTTTLYTKRLIGAFEANQKGFTGSGMKVCVIDTGVAVGHEMLRHAIADTVLNYAHDENGHGCVEPDTVIAFSNPGFVKIGEFYENLDKPEIESNVGITKLLDDREIYVYSMSLDGKVVKDRVLAVHKVPIDGEILRIETSIGNSLLLTPWHPTMIKEKHKFRFKRAEDIKSGDSIPIFDEELDRYDLVEVTDVYTEYYKGYFYDLTTEKYNNYYASGFVAHNTWCCACVAGRYAVDTRLSRKVKRKVAAEGMAPNAWLISIKALGYLVGCGSTDGILKAIEYALMRYNVDVISMSLGGPSEEEKPEDDPYYEVFNYVTERGIIPVVAAGNEGPDSNTISTPGCLPNVLTVGAYDPLTGKVANFSSRGPTNWGDIKPDCIAPGVKIHTACCGLLDRVGDNMRNRYAILDGTSMATPHVAGLVTLMKQAHERLLGKTLTLDEIMTMLKELGHEKTNDEGYGPITWGMYEEWLSTTYGIEI